MLEAFPGSFLAIEHIGSTAIPNLRAKPIIDMIGIVSDLDACDPVAKTIGTLGYAVRGENGIPGRRYFTRGGLDAVHFHLYAKSDPRIDTHLRFRDHLRANPDSRRKHTPRAAVKSGQAARATLVAPPAPTSPRSSAYA